MPGAAWMTVLSGTFEHTRLLACVPLTSLSECALDLQLLLVSIFPPPHPLLLSCYGNIAPYRNRASSSIAAGGTAMPTIPSVIMLVLVDSDGSTLPHPRLSCGRTLEAALTLKHG